MLEIVPRASCPTTGEPVLLPDSTVPGSISAFACGHRHRATLEFGAWALQ